MRALGASTFALKGCDAAKDMEKWHIWGVCDLVHTQKDDLSQSKQMGLTIYTNGNNNLLSCGQDHADVGAKGGTCFGAYMAPFGA